MEANQTKYFDFLTQLGGCSPADDSYMTIAIANAIMDCDGDYSTLSEKAVMQMQTLGKKYPDGGYGNTAPYTYLGTANYVTHNGSRPTNVTWRLDDAIPAKYLKKTNKLVVG